ncbi:hypothetical protein ACLOJK_000392 [Asimina triloba]
MKPFENLQVWVVWPAWPTWPELGPPGPLELKCGEEAAGGHARLGSVLPVGAEAACIMWEHGRMLMARPATGTELLQANPSRLYLEQGRLPDPLRLACSRPRARRRRQRPPGPRQNPHQRLQRRSQPAFVPVVSVTCWPLITGCGMLLATNGFSTDFFFLQWEINGGEGLSEKLIVAPPISNGGRLEKMGASSAVDGEDAAAAVGDDDDEVARGCARLDPMLHPISLLGLDLPIGMPPMMGSPSMTGIPTATARAERRSSVGVAARPIGDAPSSSSFRGALIIRSGSAGGAPDGSHGCRPKQSFLIIGLNV